MNARTAIKAFFSLYNLGWSAAIPLMKRNTRISDGFNQRTVRGSVPAKAHIWIHSASAGESYLSWEILKQLEFEEPVGILVSANTRQGLDILEKAAEEINGKHGSVHVRVSFSPFDKPDLMDRAVKHIDPWLMVLVELEIWPGLLMALKNKKRPVLIVNGRLTEKSLNRYLMFSSLWKHLAPENICAMSDDDAARFKILFPESHVATVSNMKFDRVPLCSDTPSEDNGKNPLTPLIEPGKPVIVMGSVREEEEQEVFDIIRKIKNDLPQARIFVFPRHMHRLEAWSVRLPAISEDWALRSAVKGSGPSLILWDTFGELTHAYRIADAAFVGGSLAPLGGQNFLEALACGVIPVTGPSWDNFYWVGQGIVDKGLLDIGQSWNSVAEKLIRHALNPLPRSQVKTMTDDYLRPFRGGTRIICAEIKRLFLSHSNREKTP